MGQHISKKYKEASASAELCIVLGFKKFDHISQGIKSLNWLTVKERLYFNDAVMVFKCVNNLVPEYLANMFVPRSHIHSRVTRSCNLLHIP